MLKPNVKKKKKKTEWYRMNLLHKTIYIYLKSIHKHIFLKITYTSKNIHQGYIRVGDYRGNKNKGGPETKMKISINRARDEHYIGSW